MECDIEVPLDITAYELFVALNKAFDLNYEVSVKEDCFLCSESPISFLIGDNLLSDYGLRDGTIINVFPQNAGEFSSSSYYLTDFDFTKVSFDYAVDMSSRNKTTIGNTAECNLFDMEQKGTEIKVSIINNGNRFFIQSDEKISIFYNGKMIILRNAK